jgi:probable phosphoglycerate mutase
VGGESGSHFRGCETDVPLASEGLAQAQAVATRLAGLEIAAVYSSPMQRAVKTAEPIAHAHGLEVVLSDGLLGIDYGQWSGKPHDYVADKWPDLYDRWWIEPHRVQFPGGGSLAILRERASRGLHEILARHDNEIVVLVSHNAVNKILICVMLDLDSSAFWRIRQDTCCISRFDHDGSGFTVLTLNEVCHLPSPPAALDQLPVG